MAHLDAGGGTRIQPAGWLLQSPGHPYPEALWFSELPVLGVLGTPGTGLIVLGVMVSCPREHKMMLERAGAAGGSWFCYLIKKGRKLGICQAGLNSLGRRWQGNQRVSPAFWEHGVGTHVSVGVLQPHGQ